MSLAESGERVADLVVSELAPVVFDAEDVYGAAEIVDPDRDPEAIAEQLPDEVFQTVIEDSDDGSRLLIWERDGPGAPRERHR